jgi:hypothetical protein
MRPSYRTPTAGSGRGSGSFVGMDPEQVIPPEEDFGLADIDDLPDEEMPPTPKEMRAA